MSELALALNEPERALEHAERALELADKAGVTPEGQRLAKLVELAGKKPEIWKERGRQILERWCRALPRDPKPFTRLAALHREQGDKALATRYASQGVELSPAADAYKKLATELETHGDSVRAKACRKIAARSQN